MGIYDIIWAISIVAGVGSFVVLKKQIVGCLFGITAVGAYLIKGMAQHNSTLIQTGAVLLPIMLFWLYRAFRYSNNKLACRRITNQAYRCNEYYEQTRLSKVHIVAICYGLFVGGFLGGVTAAGYDPITAWLVVLGVALGAFAGMFLALSLVPKQRK